MAHGNPCRGRVRYANDELIGRLWAAAEFRGLPVSLRIERMAASFALLDRRTTSSPATTAAQKGHIFVELRAAGVRNVLICCTRAEDTDGSFVRPSQRS